MTQQYQDKGPCYLLEQTTTVITTRRRPDFIRWHYLPEYIPGDKELLSIDDPIHCTDCNELHQGDRYMEFPGRADYKDDKRSSNWSDQGSSIDHWSDEGLDPHNTSDTNLIDPSGAELNTGMIHQELSPMDAEDRAQWSSKDKYYPWYDVSEMKCMKWNEMLLSYYMISVKSEIPQRINE